MPEDEENSDFQYNIDFDYSDIDRSFLNFVDKIRSSITDLTRGIDILNASVDSGTKNTLAETSSKYEETFTQVSNIIDNVRDKIDSLPDTHDIAINVIPPDVKDVMEKVSLPKKADVDLTQSKVKGSSPIKDDFEIILPPDTYEVLNRQSKTDTQQLISEIVTGIRKNAQYNIIGEDTTKLHAPYQKELTELSKSLNEVSDYLSASESNDTVDEINDLFKNELIPTIEKINKLNTTDTSEIQEALNTVMDMVSRLKGSGYTSSTGGQATPEVKNIRLDIPIPDLAPIEEIDDWNEKVATSLDESAYILMNISEDIQTFRKKFSGETAESLDILSTKLEEIAKREVIIKEILNSVPSDDAGAFKDIVEHLTAYLQTLENVKKRNLGDPLGADAAIEDLISISDGMDVFVHRLMEDIESIQTTGENIPYIKVFDPALVAQDKILSDALNQYLEDVSDNIERLKDACAFDVPIVPISIEGFSELTKQFNELADLTIRDAEALSEAAIPDSDWADEASRSVEDLTQCLLDAQNTMNALVATYKELSDQGILPSADFADGINQINSYYMALLKQRKALKMSLDVSRETAAINGDVGGSIGIVTENTLAFEEKLRDLYDISSGCTKSFGGFERVLTDMRRAINSGKGSFDDLRDSIDGSALAMLELGEQVANIAGSLTRWSANTMKNVMSEQDAVLRLQGKMKWGNAEELVDEIVKNSQGLLSRTDAATTASQFAETGMAPGNVAGIMKSARKMAVAKGTNDESVQSDMLSALQSGGFKNYNLQEVYGIHEDQWRQATERAAYEKMGKGYQEITDPFQAMQARAAGLEALVAEKYKHIDESILRPQESIKRLLTSFENLQNSLVQNFVPALQVVADTLNTIVNAFNMIPGPIKAVAGGAILAGGAFGLLITQIDRVSAGLKILKAFSGVGGSIMGGLYSSTVGMGDKGYKSVLKSVWDTIRGHKESTKALGEETEKVTTKTDALKDLATGGYGETLKKIYDWVGAHLRSIKVMVLAKIGMDQEAFAAKGLRGAMGATLTKMKDLYSHYGPIIAARYAHIKAIVLETSAKIKSVHAEYGGSGALKYIYDAIAARFSHIKVIGLEIIAKLKSAYADKGYSGALKVIYDIIKARMINNALLQSEYFLKLKTIALSKYEGVMGWLKGTKDAPGKLQPIYDIFSRLKDLYYGTDGKGDGPGLIDKIKSAAETFTSAETITDTFTKIKEKISSLDSVTTITDAASGSFGKLKGVIGSMGQSMPGVASHFEKLSGVLRGAGGVIAGAVGSLGGLASAGGVLSGILPILSTGIMSVGGALLTALGPVGIAIVAIGALVAAVLYLTGGFDGIGEALGNFASSLQSSFQPLVDFLGGIWETLQTIFGGILNIFTSFGGGIIAGFIEGIQSALAPIGEIFGTIGEVFTTLAEAFADIISVFVPPSDDGMTDFFKGIADAAKLVGKAIGFVLSLPIQIILVPLKAIAEIFKFIAGIIKVVAGLISGVLSGAISGILSAVSPIVEVFQSLWDIISTIGGMIVEAFLPASEEGDGAIDIFKGIAEAASMVGKAIGFIISLPLQILLFPLKLIAGGVKVLVDCFKGAAKATEPLRKGFDLFRLAMIPILGPIGLIVIAFNLLMNLGKTMADVLSAPFDLLKQIIDLVLNPIRALQIAFESIIGIAEAVVKAVMSPFEALQGAFEFVKGIPLIGDLFGGGEKKEEKKPAPEKPKEEQGEVPIDAKPLKDDQQYKANASALEVYNTSYDDLTPDQRKNIDKQVSTPFKIKKEEGATSDIALIPEEPAQKPELEPSPQVKDYQYTPDGEYEALPEEVPTSEDVPAIETPDLSPVEAEASSSESEGNPVVDVLLQIKDLLSSLGQGLSIPSVSADITESTPQGEIYSESFREIPLDASPTETPSQEKTPTGAISKPADVQPHSKPASLMSVRETMKGHVQKMISSLPESFREPVQQGFESVTSAQDKMLKSVGAIPVPEQKVIGSTEQSASLLPPQVQEILSSITSPSKNFNALKDTMTDTIRGGVSVLPEPIQQGFEGAVVARDNALDKGAAVVEESVDTGVEVASSILPKEFRENYLGAYKKITEFLKGTGRPEKVGEDLKNVIGPVSGGAIPESAANIVQSSPVAQVMGQVSPVAETVAPAMEQVAPAKEVVEPAMNEVSSLMEETSGFSEAISSLTPSTSSGREGAEPGMPPVGDNTANSETTGAGGEFGTPAAMETTGAAQKGNVSVMVQGASFPITITSNELAHAITNKQINMDQIADRIARKAAEMLAEQISREIVSWGS